MLTDREIKEIRNRCENSKPPKDTYRPNTGRRTSIEDYWDDVPKLLDMINYQAAQLYGLQFAQLGRDILKHYVYALEKALGKDCKTCIHYPYTPSYALESKPVFTERGMEKEVKVPSMPLICRDCRPGYIDGYRGYEFDIERFAKED